VAKKSFQQIQSRRDDIRKGYISMHPSKKLRVT